MLNAKGKKLLNQIDTYLSTDERAAELWDILTALRGPDLDHWDKDKTATTAVIRYTALPNTAATADPSSSWPYASRISAEVVRDTKSSVEQRKSLPRGHFSVHAHRAFKALGLDWDKENK